MMKTLFTIGAFVFSLGMFGQGKHDKNAPTAGSQVISANVQIDSVRTDGNKTALYVTSETKKWWSDWLPFVATLIVAYAAYRGVIKQSKASSISGFRVNWIEDLRVSYSKFLIALRNVDSKLRTQGFDLRQNTKDEDLEQLQFLRTKIKLLINHGETEHIAFWEALTQYMQQHNEYYRGDYSEEKELELDKMRVQIEQLLLTIFKKEWDKAKNFG